MFSVLYEMYAVSGLFCIALGFMLGHMWTCIPASECRFSNPRRWQKHEREMARAVLRNAVDALDGTCGIGNWLDQIRTAIRELQMYSGQQNMELYGIRLESFGSEQLRIGKGNDYACFSQRTVIQVKEDDREQTHTRYGMSASGTLANGIRYAEDGKPSDAELDKQFRTQIADWLQHIVDHIPR